MNKLVVHVGYPKCASTFIQKKVFARIDCNYVCGPETSVLCSDDFDKEEFLASLSATGHYDHSRSLTVISSPPISSPGLERYHPHYFDVAMQNLKCLNQDVKVIIIVRNQLELIKSWYVYSVTRGLNTVTCKSFKSWLDEDFSVLNPELLLQSCTTHIGAEKMLVLPVELLSSDSELFVRYISEFLHSEVGPIEMRKVNRGSYNGYSVGFWRFFNFFYLGLSSVAGKIGVSTHRGSLWHTQVKRRYQKLKVFLNPYIEKYCSKELDLKVPETKIAEYQKKFTAGNALVNRYSAYPLNEFQYPIES